MTSAAENEAEASFPLANVNAICPLPVYGIELSVNNDEAHVKAEGASFGIFEVS